MIEAVPYEAALAGVWDDLVRRARNGHFLFERPYLDYHADRFPDASFLFRKGGKWLGLVPGHRTADDGWASHRGLTFGGLVLAPEARGLESLEMFDRLDEALRERGIRRAWYRPVPWFHQREPSQDDLYALFRRSASLEARTLSTLHRPVADPPLDRLRRRNAARSAELGTVCGPDDDWAGFWALLEAGLRDRHGVSPVHSLAEIRLLASRFPDRIRLWSARADGRWMAGAVSYESPEVFHMQYSAASDEGRDSGALTQLFLDLMSGPALSHRFFNFGHSCEQGGRVLNDGLLSFKESFGGHGAVYEEYAWDPGVAS